MSAVEPGRPGPGRVDFGRRVLLLGAPGGRLSVRIGARSAAVVALLCLAAFGVLVTTLLVGDYDVTVARVAQAIFGTGERYDEYIVVGKRLPRALLALLLGAALGVSGAIIQSLTRNPLGSPDVIGFNTGAYTGALIVVVLGGNAYLGQSAGALIGGVATALVVYLLAFSRGVRGFRLIVVGIGVSAMLASLNTWLILTADLDTALSVAGWGVGSLSGSDWATVRGATLALAVVLVLLIPFAVRMKVLELGDDAAVSLGVRREPTRLGLLVGGVALTAIATAAAGPISFVALAAPQVARRLTRSAGVTLVPAAAMGALLLAASDLAAQRLFAPTALPVGVLTVVVGGVYLVWLIARETRKN